MTDIAAEPAPVAPSPAGNDDADGRRLRRDRNRDAVVDAMLALFREGNLQPSSVEIAERAGLSPRSVFRYFDDIDDLSRAAIERQQARVWPLVAVDVTAEAALADRIDAFVEARVRLFDAIGNVGRAARLREPSQPLVAAELTRGRSFLRRQLRDLFSPELEAMPSARAAGVLAALDVLCSYESYQLLRTDQMLSRAKAAAALTDALHALLVNRTTTDPEESR